MKLSLTQLDTIRIMQPTRRYVETKCPHSVRKNWIFFLVPFFDEIRSIKVHNKLEKNETVY